MTASPDSSGILTQIMALRTVARGGVEATATHLDTLVRMPLARQIQAQSRISFTINIEKTWKTGIIDKLSEALVLLVNT